MFHMIMVPSKYLVYLLVYLHVASSYDGFEDDLEVEIKTTHLVRTRLCRYTTDAELNSKLGKKYTIGGVECVCIYEAETEQSWGKYILCETHDLHDYEPELGTGGVDETYTGKPWGNVNQGDSGSTEIGTGKENTDNHISQYPTNSHLWYYVNQHRQNTGKQWHVPSYNELELVYNNRDIIGNFSISTDSQYWSSSEYSWYYAYSLDFNDGSMITSSIKNANNHRVRLCLYATDSTFIEKTVEITCDTEGADIRYTLDGNEPTSSSTLYTGAFTVAPPVMIKAKGFKTGMLDSDVASDASSFTRVSSGSVGA